MIFTRKKIWSVLFRLYHWAFAGSIIILVVTGLYIYNPWSKTMLESTGNFPMADMRYFHFLAGYFFIAAIAARFYLMFFGNRHERFWDYTPVTLKNIKHFCSHLAFYLYLTDDHKERGGHNTVAGTVYFVTFFVAVLQLISGLYMLYPESALWQSWGLAIFGPQQAARFLHHAFMWVFILFMVVHLYMCTWNEMESGGGFISSIFSGNKYKIKKT